MSQMMYLSVIWKMSSEVQRSILMNLNSRKMTKNIWRIPSCNNQGKFNSQHLYDCFSYHHYQNDYFLTCRNLQLLENIF